MMMEGLARKLGRPLPQGSGVVGGGRTGLALRAQDLP
mgnify:CR=1 FL=1